MKRFIAVILLSSTLTVTLSNPNFLASWNSASAITIKHNGNTVQYNGVINQAPDGFFLPLIGLFNLAQGTHRGGQIGLINITQENQHGGQMGLYNMAVWNINGAQVGLINISEDANGAVVGLINANEKINGLQAGLVNTSESVNGVQLGLVNASEETYGVQFGLVNAVEDVYGVGFGLVNATGAICGVEFGMVNVSEWVEGGVELGLLNVSHDLYGVGLGLVNITTNLKGIQLGLVNVVESVKKGVPFGLITLVEKGGYRALELSTSEMFPVNLSYKMGTKKLYTNYVLSYHPDLDNKIAVGIGAGTNVNLSNAMYLNPEILTQNRIVSRNSFMYSFGLNVGYKLTENLHLTAGPSFVWNHAGNPADLFRERFAINKWSPDNQNNLIFGARIGLRYVLTKF